MRGSPFLRSFLLAIALAATAAGLARVTSPRQAAHNTTEGTVIEKKPVVGNAIPFRLLLSDPASDVLVTALNELRPSLLDSPISGSLELNPANPSLGLIVRWKTAVAPGEHRFAKLTLEAPGQPTFTHVFDADGDIDDFIELPFPAEK
ncbi:MAG: hypothetical protein EOP85_17275 [Verrucomicrobiaceae bacterium]|nr:MAG: hypothetical protein EOP85_17275 [Verrucomicrobiaceae bacterium]